MTRRGTSGHLFIVLALPQMNNLKTEDISAILELLNDSGFDELHVEMGDFEVYVARRGAGLRRLGRPSPAEATQAAESPARAQAVAAAQPAPAARPAGQAAKPAEAEAVGDAGDAKPISAPLMGTFYRSATPGTPPFVEVGQVVTPETTIGIIEVMKLMNQIPAGISGVIDEILVENGALVEFGQPIMLVSANDR